MLIRVTNRALLAGPYVREGEHGKALRQVPALIEDLTPLNINQIAIDMLRSGLGRSMERERDAVPKGPLIERFLAVPRTESPAEPRRRHCW